MCLEMNGIKELITLSFGLDSLKGKNFPSGGSSLKLSPISLTKYGPENSLRVKVVELSSQGSKPNVEISWTGRRENCASRSEWLP